MTLYVLCNIALDTCECVYRHHAPPSRETPTPTPTAHPTLVWCCSALCCWACSTPAHLITFVIKAVAKGWWIMPELLPRCSCRGNEAAQQHLPHCCWPWRSLTGTRNTSLWHMNAVGRSGRCMSVWLLLLIQYYSTNCASNSMKALIEDMWCMRSCFLSRLKYEACREFAGCVMLLLIEIQW